MEIIVGVSGCEHMLSKLLENRIGKQRAKGKGFLVEKTSERNYVLVRWEDTACAFDLCDILADIIIESLQVRYLNSLFLERYSYVPVCDQGEILIMAVKKLWYGASGAEHLEQVKRNVSNRVAACLFENRGGILSLDGVMRFRMKDYIKKWDMAFDDCVQAYYHEREKKEFIKLLRYFVCMRDSKLKTVHLRAGRDGEVNIYDEWGKRVEVQIGDDLPMDSKTEDVLLSRLIVICPEQIFIDQHLNSTLEQLIRQVFVGRVHKRAGGEL